MCPKCCYLVQPGTLFCAHCGYGYYSAVSPHADNGRSNIDCPGSGVDAAVSPVAPGVGNHDCASPGAQDRTAEPQPSQVPSRDGPPKDSERSPPSNPDGWMRECELQVDDLPIELTGIVLWRNALRRSTTVACNRDDVQRVEDWFNGMDTWRHCARHGE